MNTLLKAIFVAAIMTVVPVILPAQTKPVVHGRTSVSSSAFLQYVESFNVTVTDLAGNPLPNNAATFPVREGAIDLQTGTAEITNAGGYEFRGNGSTVRIQDLVVNTIVPANPVVTALFIVNDKLIGRSVLYQIKETATVKLPLKPQSGTEQINGLSLTLAQAAANILNNSLIIGEPVLQSGEAAGTAEVYAVLSPNNSDQ